MDDDDDDLDMVDVTDCRGDGDGDGDGVRRARVRADFHALSPDQLSVRAGDLVYCSSQGARAHAHEHNVPGWLFVYTAAGTDGARGLVPGLYLEVEDAVPAQRVDNACTTCNQPLHCKPVATLWDTRGRRACEHFVHFDCALGTGQCPTCAREFASCIPTGKGEDSNDAWFKAVDVDGDDLASAEDVLAYLKAVVPLPSTELARRLRVLWPSLHPDSRGLISVEAYRDSLAGQANGHGLVGRILALAPATRTPPPLSDKQAWFAHFARERGTLAVGEICRAVQQTVEPPPSTASIRAAVEGTMAGSDWQGGLVTLDAFEVDGGVGDALLSLVPRKPSTPFSVSRVSGLLASGADLAASLYCDHKDQALAVLAAAKDGVAAYVRLGVALLGDKVHASSGARAAADEPPLLDAGVSPAALIASTANVVE